LGQSDLCGEANGNVFVQLELSICCQLESIINLGLEGDIVVDRGNETEDETRFLVLHTELGTEGILVTSVDQGGDETSELEGWLQGFMSNDSIEVLIEITKEGIVSWPLMGGHVEGDGFEETEFVVVVQ